MGKSGKESDGDDSSCRENYGQSGHTRDNSPMDQSAASNAGNEANSQLYGSPEGMNCAGKVNEPNDHDDASATLPVSYVTAHFSDTHRKLDFIIQKLEKLDVIEEKIQKLDSKVNFVLEKFDGIKYKTDQISELSRSLEHQKEKMAELTLCMERHRSEVEKISGEMVLMSAEKDDLSSKVLDLQCRSMQYNLVFTGLLGETSGEDTESKLRDFIYNELNINRNIQFGNVHRFGKAVRGKPRPIVAEFLYNFDKEEVLGNTYKLRGSQFSIHEQFPKAIEERRQKLYPVLNELKRTGVQNVKLVRDKLYINGKLYNEYE